MNARATLWIFGLLLSVLWIFGFVVSQSRNLLHEKYVFPSLHRADRLVFDAVEIKRTHGGKPETIEFTMADDYWYLHEGGQKLRVQGYKIETKIAKAVQKAQRSPRKVTQSRNELGLDPPERILTIKGRSKSSEGELGPQREWTLHLGKETADGKSIYAVDASLPERVFVVATEALKGLEINSPHEMREMVLVNFDEKEVQRIALRENDTKLELVRNEWDTWRIAEPNLGWADQDAVGPKAPGSQRPGNTLLYSLVHIRVDRPEDFLPADPKNLDQYGLADGKAWLAIETVSQSDSASRKEPGKITKMQTLLVGKEEGKHFYARLKDDPGVFKIPGHYLDPIRAAIANPQSLRSKTLLPISSSQVERFQLRVGAESADFAFKDKKWQISQQKQPMTPANQGQVGRMIQALDLKPVIDEFLPEGADDAKLGLAPASAELKVALKAPEDVQKGVKVEVALEFGKHERRGDKDYVAVKRRASDGGIARFWIPKDLAEALIPVTGILTYVSPALPTFDSANADAIVIDFGAQQVKLVQRNKRWFVRENDETYESPANAKSVSELLDALENLPNKKWIAKVGPKDDLKPYGLTSPQSKVKVFLQKGATKEIVEIAFGKETDDIMDRPGQFAKSSLSDKVFLVNSDLMKALRKFPWRSPVDVQMGFGVQTCVALQALCPLMWASPLALGPTAGTSADEVQALKVTLRTVVETRVFQFQREGKSWKEKGSLSGFQPDDAKVQRVAELLTKSSPRPIIGLEGAARSAYKLKPDAALLEIEATLPGGKTVTLRIGERSEDFYFAQLSTWPEAVFLIPTESVAPIIVGAVYFSRPAAD